MKQKLKKELRSNIASLKRAYSSDELRDLSNEVVDLLGQLPRLKSAKTILLYYSLPDEVFTHEFINRISKHKIVLLPVVTGNNTLELRRYISKEDLKLGAYGIWEPIGELFTAYNTIDLAIIPGVAFDKKGNRLGRGKGYYDRFLPNLKAYKVGICFPFQYIQNATIPTEDSDIPMDQVITTK